MKKIFRYIVFLLAIIVAVRVFVYFLTKTYYKDMNNYEITTENLQIEILESKISKSKGYIKGRAINNSGEIITNMVIKFDFYNDNGKYIGSEYEPIKYFNATEQIKFDVKYTYQDVNKIKISIVNN